MALKLQSGVQARRVKYIDIVLADLVTAVPKKVMKLPPNAHVVGGFFEVTEAFNSTSSDALVVGDSAVANRYKSTTSIATTGNTALVPTYFRTTYATREVYVTWTSGGGTPTTGKVTLWVEYVVRGAADLGPQD